MSEQTQVVPTVGAQAGALPPMSDDDLQQLTRSIRIGVITKITTNPATQGMPQDKTEAALLSNMLNGLDAQVINNKRLAQEQRNNDNTAVIVAEMLRTVNKQTAFQVRADGTTDVVDVAAKVVPTDIGDVQAVPGEMDVAPPQLDYASFVRSQGKDVDEMGKDVKHAEAEDPDDTP